MVSDAAFSCSGLLVWPQLNCISCACMIRRHHSSSTFGGWSHQYYFYRGRSYLHLFLRARCPYQRWHSSLGWGSFPQFQSWCLTDICHCMLFQGITPVPSLFWKQFHMLLAQGQNCSLPSQYTGPECQCWFRDPGLFNLKVSYLCTSWAWRLVPCYRQLGSSIYYLQVGGMVSIWPLPHLFSIFIVLMLN